MATKWPFAIIALTVVGAAGIAWRQHEAAVSAMALRLALFGILAPLFLVLIAPYLVIDWRTVVDNLHGEDQAWHLGASGGSFVQNIAWYLGIPLRKAFGVFGLLMAGAGLILCWRSAEKMVILGLTVLVFYALICSQNLVWERWALPLIPPLAILAALGLDRAWRVLAARLNPRESALAAGLTLAALLVPLTAAARHPRLCKPA